MIQDLVSQDPHHIKGLFGRHGIHQHIAMDADEMLRIKNAIFILPKRA
jgi:hypothetical protein